jgi:hypothetical protein
MRLSFATEIFPFQTPRLTGLERTATFLGRKEQIQVEAPATAVSVQRKPPQPALFSPNEPIEYRPFAFFCVALARRSNLSLSGCVASDGVAIGSIAPEISRRRPTQLLRPSILISTQLRG